jgi:hypothetical protein
MALTLAPLRSCGALLPHRTVRRFGPRRAALLDRDPAAHVSVDNPWAAAKLLDILRKADTPRKPGAHGQITALAERAAAHVPLDDPRAAARLLDSLREAGAQEQVSVLVERLPGAGMFKLFSGQEDRQDRFRFGREADGSPAGP